MKNHGEPLTANGPYPRPDQFGDRRENERLLTLYRVGLITTDGISDLCLVRNLSSGGMKIRVYRHMPVGKNLLVELKTGQGIFGKVSWVQGHNIGVTFDEPIDLVSLLSASIEGPAPRMPRIELSAKIAIREGGSVYRTLACDISQGGLKVALALPVSIGADVVITLPGLTNLAGFVSWAGNGYWGITFNRLLPLPELVNWLRDQNDDVLAVS